MLADAEVDSQWAVCDGLSSRVLLIRLEGDVWQRLDQFGQHTIATHTHEEITRLGHFWRLPDESEAR